MILGAFATYKGFESIAVAVIGALTGSILVYVWGETKRPSNQNNENNEQR